MRPKEGRRPSRFNPEIAAVVVFALVVALVAFVRLRLADVPFERDEGEYAYAGQLILNGTPPYEAAYNMKFPGTYYAYAVLMSLFGKMPAGIRIGLLMVNLLTIGMVFTIGRRLLGTIGACAAGSAFALLALDSGAMGLFAHATHFVVFFICAAFLMLLTAMRSGRTWHFVATGVLVGLGVIMKQQALFLALAVIVLAGVRPRLSWRPAAFVAAGFASAMVLLVAVMAASGVLSRFWFWTIDYARAYASGTPASVALEVFGMAWSMVAGNTGVIWYAGLAGLVALGGKSWRGDTRVVLGVWLIAAAACVSAGFFFRPHYFILAMPAVALLVGVLVVTVQRALGRALGGTKAGLEGVAVLLVLAGIYVGSNTHFLFRMDSTELIRSVYSTNPFLESPEVARYIAATTTPADRIAVLGSEPQILFYAGRPSATGYIYMYPLTERHPFAGRMQDEMIREIDSAQPAVVVLVESRSSWVATLQPDMRMTTWARALVARCYDRVGVIDIDPNGPATVLWDAASRGYEPRFSSRLLTYRRKPC